MSSLARALDKFNGVKLCDMTTDELNEFFSAITERGAYLGANNALAHVGLNDENAGADVKDLRSLLTGYRLVRSTTKKAAWGAFARILQWVFTIGFIFFFMRNTEIGQLMLKTMMKGGTL